MNDYIDYLKKYLNLREYILVKVGRNKLVLFKTYSNYTKCIYITLIGTRISIEIDKVFDSIHYPPYIERLIIGTANFEDFTASLGYIEKSIAN